MHFDAGTASRKQAVRLEMSVAKAEVSGVKLPGISQGQAREHLSSRSCWKDVQEKQLRLCVLVTVLKLTQVGEMSNLRRSGERWLRNSAKWPRKFAIRGA
jgi:hypothetical protein